MPILDMCQWLQDTTLATSIRQSSMAFPLIEGSHVLSLSISVGIVMFLDLRLLRLAFRNTPISRLMKQLGPWMIAGMTIMMLTGFLLFFAQAKNAYVNNFFRVKMLLLVLGGLNALFYQIKYFPRMADWDLSEKVPTGVKVVALLSLVFWFGVIVCGRTMAYEI
jgi:hypothetical protein